MSTAAIGTPDMSRTLSSLSTLSISPSALTSVVSTPRVGTEFKDRIFVGGFPPATTDTELRGFFAKFGSVKEAKIIRDHGGASKGYGFITYETEDEAKKVRESCGGFLNADNGDELLDFKGRKLNIGPAIRKASNSRNQNLDVIPQGAVVLSANGTPFVVQNGFAYCANPETYAVTHPGVNGGYPLIIPQQFILQAPPHPQYAAIPSSGPPATGAPMPQQITQVAPQMVQQIPQQEYLQPMQTEPYNRYAYPPQQAYGHEMHNHHNPPMHAVGGGSHYAPIGSPPRYSTPTPQRSSYNTPPQRSAYNNANAQRSTPQRAAYNNNKYTGECGRGGNVVMNTNGYIMRNGYNSCPDCSDAHNVSYGSNPTGIVTPPQTPIVL